MLCIFTSKSKRIWSPYVSWFMIFLGPWHVLDSSVATSSDHRIGNWFVHEAAKSWLARRLAERKGTGNKNTGGQIALSASFCLPVSFLQPASFCWPWSGGPNLRLPPKSKQVHGTGTSVPADINFMLNYQLLCLLHFGTRWSGYFLELSQPQHLWGWSRSLSRGKKISKLSNGGAASRLRLGALFLLCLNFRWCEGIC